MRCATLKFWSISCNVSVIDCSRRSSSSVNDKLRCCAVVLGRAMFCYGQHSSVGRDQSTRANIRFEKTRELENITPHEAVKGVTQAAISTSIGFVFIIL